MKCIKLYSLLFFFSLSSLAFAGLRLPSFAPGKYIPEFSLINQFNKEITQDALKGKIVVMNFIFTRCQAPHMCPASTKRMVELQTMVKEQRVKNVQFVTLTFDPEYDTPEVLKMYAQAYQINNSNFYLLTGSSTTIKKLLKHFAIYTAPQKGSISHNIKTLLFDPNGKLYYYQAGHEWSAPHFLKKIQTLQSKSISI